MDIKDWVADFLRKSRIASPDGRSLYAYRMSADEYQKLRQKLIGIVHCYQMGSLVKNKFFRGAFVLYAAEWWRREYQGGAWRWDDILRSLEIKDISFPQQKTAVVQ